MAPRKPVKSLLEIAENTLISSLKTVFQNLGTNSEEPIITSDKISKLKSCFEVLPVTLHDELAHRSLDLAFEEDENGDFDIDTHMLKCTYQILANERTQRLIIYCDAEDRLYDPANSVKNCLLKFSSLQQLTLDNATDELIEIVGKNCRKLKMLNISHGEVTLEGFHWIVPSDEEEANEVCINNGCDVKPHGCPDLETLIIKYSTLRLELPFLKFFRNLKTYSGSCLVLQEDAHLVVEVANLAELVPYHAPSSDLGNVNMFPSKFPQLKSIQIGINKADLKYLVVCPNLTEIYLFIKEMKDGDDDFQKLIEQHPNNKNFKKIHLKSSTSLHDFDAIATHCKNIKDFWIRIRDQPSSFNEVQPQMEGERFTQLKNFTLVSFYNDELFNKLLLQSVLFLAQNIETVELCINPVFPSLDQLFKEIILRNPLRHIKHFGLDFYRHHAMSQMTGKLLADLPNMRQLEVPLDLTEYLRTYARENNFDLNFNVDLWLIN